MTRKGREVTRSQFVWNYNDTHKGRHHFSHTKGNRLYLCGCDRAGVIDHTLRVGSGYRSVKHLIEREHDWLLDLT